MEIYRRLSTPKLWAVIKTQTISDDGVLADGVLANPSTSTKIIIEDSTGVVVQALTDMTSSGDTGKYYYNGYTIPADAKLGVWNYEVRATAGTLVASIKSSFIVEEQVA